MFVKNDLGAENVEMVINVDDTSDPLLDHSRVSCFNCLHLCLEAMLAEIWH